MLSNLYLPKTFSSTEAVSSLSSSSILLEFNLNVVSDAIGSSYVKIGKSMVICSVHGPQSRTYSNNIDDSTGIFECECHYAPFAYKDDIDKRKKNELERNMTYIIKDSLEKSIKLEKYPKTSILLYIVILQSDELENDTSTAINAGSLALADASIELSDLVTSCTILNNNNNNNNNNNLNDKGICMIAFMLSLEEITQIWFQGRLDMNEIINMTTDAKQKCSIIKDIMKRTLIEKVLKLK